MTHSPTTSGGPRIQVSPNRPTLDTSLHIRLLGLAPHTPVVLRARRIDHHGAAWSSWAASNRAVLRQRKIKAVIPQRRDHVANRLRKGSAGGRPPGFDAEHYKRRNQVERGYNRRKQFRALATRYDKLGLHWQATNDIVETMDWLRATPDKSRPDPADTP